LSIPPNPYPLALLPYLLFILDIMMILEVSSELFAAVEDLGALIYTAGGEGMVAAPGFDLIMLRVFMAFPVVFGAKGFGAGRVGAAVRARMAFLVFPSEYRS